MNASVLHISLKEAKKALITVYAVGVVGMLLPWSFPLFQMLIPYTLLFCFFMLALFHQGKLNLRNSLFYLFVLVAGFAVEVYGVKTGQIFGQYTYGAHIGIKVFDTPLLIGLNWLFLVYSTAALTDKLKMPLVAKVLLPSLAMVVYDLVAEQVAPVLGMWSFKGGSVPFQNYLAWFGLALVFHTLLRVLHIRTANPLSVMLLGLQFVFFIILLLFLPK